MKKKTVIWLIVCVVVVGIAITAWAVISSATKNLEALKATEISDVDLTNAKDGVYDGSCSAFPISAKVEVTLKDNRIESIKLVEHKSGKGQAADAIPEKVVEAQTLKVDAISGATSSSQVIKKAIQDALQKAAG